MKRVLVLLLICLGQVSLVWGADFPRHIDPELLFIDNPIPAPLFGIYSSIYGSIAFSDYEEALDLIGTVDDLYALPDSKRSLSDYNELLKIVIMELSETELNIGEAYGELQWVRETEAYSSFIEAYPHLTNANITTGSLVNESQVLADSFDGSPSELLSGTLQVEDFVGYLDSMIQQGLLEIERISAEKLAGLEESGIELSVDNSRPVVGGEVILSGVLRGVVSGGLEGKSVEIVFDDEIIAHVVTDTSGGFSVTLDIPFRYVDLHTVQCTFWPSLDDDSYYTPTRSSLVLKPVFYTPSISLNLPEVVYPGISYDISGKVSFEGLPLVDMGVSVEGFREEISVNSAIDGGFSTSIKIPHGARSVSYPIVASTLSSGVYGPKSVTQSVVVDKIGLNVETEKSLFTLSGLETTVSGTVSTGEGPLFGCLIVAEFGDEKKIESTDFDGVFEVSLPTNFFALSTRKELILTAIPQDPWIETRVVSESILILNTVFTVPAILLVAALIYRQKQRETVSSHPMSQLAPLLKPVIYPELSGISGVYVRAVKIISRVSGLDLHPSFTIREYLDNVRSRLSRRLYGLFNQLSRYYERWIYGRKRSRPPIRTSEIILEKIEDEQDSA